MHKKSLILLFILLFSIVPSSFIPEVFAVDIPTTDGFESGTYLPNWLEGLPGGHGYSYNTDVVKTGTYSVIGNSTEGQEMIIDSTLDLDAVYVKFDFYMNDSIHLGVPYDMYLCTVHDNDEGYGISIKFNSFTDGIPYLSLYDDYWGTEINGNVNFTAGEWLRINLVTNWNSDSCENELYVDGIKIANMTTDHTGYQAKQFILVGIDSGYFYNYVDDFIISDVPISFNGISLEVDGENFNPPDPDFVFVDWKYYNFNLTIKDLSLNSTDIDFVFMRFDLPTYEGLISVAPYYDNVSDVWGLITTATDPDRAGEPILVQDGSTSSLIDATEFIFSLWFEDKCLDVYDPGNAIGVDIAWNETDGYSSSWSSFENVFRVYNDGGFADDVTIIGNAGVLPGGRDLNMFGYNDSYVLKEIVWRDSVHIKILPTTHFRAGYSTWDQYYSLGYMLEDGIQKPGLQLKIEPSFVSYTGVFAGQVWINMTCSWYGNNSLIKTDNLYMFYHGTVFNQGDAGRWKFWVDLWFDNTNGSTVIGGRINAYEYAVEDGSAAWVRWLSSNWGVKDNVTKQSECFYTLLDEDNKLPTNSENVKFAVLQSVLSVDGVAESDQFVGITDLNLDVTLAQQLPMKGINAPPWDETQQPVVGNSGLIGALFSMFSGLGGWISENLLFGGLNLWGNFVAFLDTIAAWLGAPGFFTWLFDEIGAGLVYLYESANYVVGILASVFSMFTALLGSFVSVITDLITSFVDFLTIFTDMMSGGYGAGVNVWNDLGISTWLTVAIIFYPLYLVFLWEKKGMGAVMEQLGWIFGLLVGIYKLLEGIILGVVQLITSLIEAIPVAE